MTKDDRIASFKHSILQYARKHKNIIYTCRTFNLSRTVYYKWLKRFSKLGYLGLQDLVILPDSSTFCTQGLWINSTPSRVPKIAPVIDPLESLSPE